MVNKSTITTAQLLNLYDITYVYLPCLVWKKKRKQWLLAFGGASPIWLSS